MAPALFVVMVTMATKVKEMAEDQGGPGVSGGQGLVV